VFTIFLVKRLRTVKWFPLDFLSGCGHIRSNARKKPKRGGTWKNGWFKRGQE
jgi:hypothetical protein